MKPQVYCVNYAGHAGKWIYDGYRGAWEKLGYDVGATPSNKEFDSSMAWLGTPTDFNEDYYLMVPAAMMIREDTLIAAQHARKSFLFVQPQTFPHPWGSHPNFTCNIKQHLIDAINEIESAVLWTFADVNEENQHFYSGWNKKIHTFPLAFDSINYQPESVDKYKQFDISFVGGWADNGFNEKRKIILDIFREFKDSGLKCGFFVNKNLTHQQECNLLANSKMTLNIHDAYQRVLGFDTNERTFKSLGLNGLMISDSVTHLSKLFPEIKTSLDPKELVTLAKEVLSLPEDDREELRQRNKDDILKNHCYTNRIQEMLKV